MASETAKSTATRNSFNEAEARGPRKWAPIRAVHHAGLEASMRPRPVGLGNGGGSRHFHAAGLPASMRPRPVGLGNASMKWKTLSSSTCFNEAEARGPRKWIGWGDDAQAKFGASMRPRPVGLGNVRLSVMRYSDNDASMRPRPVGLGNGRGPSRW